MLPAAIAPLYAQALLAITRADHEVGPEEGRRLQVVLDARTGEPVAIEDLLLSDPLRPEGLSAAIAESGGPFRGGVAVRELATTLVTDALHVLGAKGYISEGEARLTLRFARALGCSGEDVARIAPQLGLWIDQA